MADQISRTILQYITDQAALRKSQQALADLRADHQKLVREFERRPNDTTAIRLVSSQREVRRLVTELETLRAKMQQIESIKLLPDLDGEGGGRTLGQRVTALGRGIFNAPAIGPSTPIARGLIGAGGVIDALGASIGQLALAAGIATPAVIATAIAVDRFNESIQASKRFLNANLSAQDNYYEALRTLTSKEAAQQVDDLTRTQVILKQQIKETKDALDASFRDTAQTFSAIGSVFGLGSSSAIFGDLAARMLDNQTGASQLREQLEGLQKTYDTNQATIIRLTQGLSSFAFGANDAREAAEIAAKTILEIARAERQLDQARIQSSINLRQQMYAFERNPNAEALTNRLQELNDERRAIQDSLGYLEANRQDSEEANQTFRNAVNRLREIRLEFNQLARGETATAIRGLNEQLQTEVSEIITQSNLRIAQLRQQQADAEAKALAERNTALFEAQRKANLAREKQEEEHQTTLRRIVSRANATIANAVASRDALAAYLAEQNKKQQIAEENESNAQRLEAIDTALREENRTIELRYQQQVQTAQETARRAIETERAKAQAEISLRNQAATTILRNLQSALQAQIAIENAANEARILATLNTQDRISAILLESQRRYIVPQSAIVPPSAVQKQIRDEWNGIPGLPKYEHGTPYVQRTGPAIVHRGERIIPASQNSGGWPRRMMQGVPPVVINGYGLNRRQVVQMVDRALVDYDRGIDEGMTG